MGGGLFIKSAARLLHRQYYRFNLCVPTVEFDYYPHRAELFCHFFAVAVLIHTEDKMGIKQLKDGYFGVFLP